VIRLLYTCDAVAAHSGGGLVVHGGVAGMRTCVGDSELRASEQKQLSWVGFNGKFTITLMDFDVNPG